MDPVDVVNQFEQALNDRDPATMVAACHPDALYNGPGAPASNLKGEEIGTFFAEIFRAMPDSRFDVGRIFGAGDMVAVEWVFQGTMTETLWGFSPTGGSCAVRGSHLLQVEDGKIRSVQAYWDNHTLFEQLGIKPAD